MALETEKSLPRGRLPIRSGRELLAVLVAADEAERHARLRRALHRRRSLPARRRQLEEAVAGLEAAMAPLRSELGRLHHLPQVEARFGVEIRARSRALQLERKALLKMLAR